LGGGELFGESAMIIGCTLANAEGDKEKANKMGAEFYRLTCSQALQWNKGIDKPYMLLLSGAINDDDYLKLADDLLSVWGKLIKKPSYILCQNEQNELSYKLAQNVRKAVGDKIQVPIVKGPYTACCENAGYNKYKTNELDIPSMPEALNYYERPTWKTFYWFDNWKRRLRFKCILKKLRKHGITEIIVSEFHSADRSRPGFEEVHGDYVYQDRRGFDSIVRFLDEQGVKVGLYYTCSFLGRDGNDVL
jgi:hypothetical protein